MRKVVASILTPAVGVFVVAASAFASGGAVEVTTHEPAPSPAGVVAFAHVPASSDSIVVFAEDAQVKVHRDAAAGDVVIASACPHDWNVTGNVVRQAGFSTKRNGVAMMADALGSRAIVNGRIYSLPNGQIGGGISMGKDGLFVGGKKMDPIEGSDIPGTCTGPDAIDVTVPATFSGNLVIGAGEKSQIELDGWKGGNVQVTLISAASLRAHDLTGLSKAAIDLRGDGSAQVDNLSCRVLVANVTGKGTMNLTNGKADISNATVSGAGSITMKGTFNNLKQAVEGDGKIKVN